MQVKIIATACLLACMTSVLHGQPVSLYARDYEMATVRGDALPQFSGIPLDELRVMAYVDGVWLPIPFQVDEKDASGSYFNADETTGFDSNDEIVFMAFDRGEWAPGPGVWPDDDASKILPRGVANVLDTITETGIGYVYIYRSATLPLNSTDYIDYTPPAFGTAGLAANDMITGLTYSLGNDGSNGFPDFVSILVSVGGSGADLADRFNIEVNLTARITIIFPIEFDVTVTEDDFKNARVNNYVDGDIRILKQVLVDLDVQSLASIDDIEIPMEHTPYSLQLSGTFDLSNLPSEVKSINRFSLVFDFNDNAIPMTLYTPYNQGGLSVNGQGGETFDDTPLFLPERYPFHTTGTQGTVVNIFTIPQLGNMQSAFFEDSASRTGAHGFELREQIAVAEPAAGLLAISQTVLPLGFTGFFLPPNLPNILGEELAKAVRTPIATVVTSQEFQEGVVPVELVSFQANVNRKDVELTWVTATETNNLGFEVERSSGRGSDWLKLGFVGGHHTTVVTQRYRFVDVNREPGIYHYRLKQIDTDGSFEYSEALDVIVALPERFVVHQNFPNPFNPATEIRYELPAVAGQDVHVRTTLKIYDLLGREIRTLVDGQQPAGFHSVSWNGTDDFDQPIPSGVYLYRLRSGDFSATRKMIFVK